MSFAEGKLMTKSVFSIRYQAFLKHLVAARQSAGLTQVQVATRLGKPQSYVSKAENGERRLDFVEFVELARAMGIKELDLASAIISDAAFTRSDS